MSPKKHLTALSTRPDSVSEITAQLEEAGLELWQAPEGFWAIRVRQSAPALPPRRARRRRVEGQA